MDYLLNQIGREELEHFVEPIYRKLLDKRVGSTLDHETIKALFKHHFNLAAAAGLVHS